MRDLDLDVFFIDEERMTLEWMYYNPDSVSEGQFVENRIELDDVISAFHYTSNPEDFFGVLQNEARCLLYNKGEACFEDGREMFNTDKAFLVKRYADIRKNKDDVRSIFIKCLGAMYKYYSEGSENG